MLRTDDSAIRRLAAHARTPLCDALLHALRRTTPAGAAVPTLLAVCPTSVAVVKASLLAAQEADAPLCFAATLNQVDTDGGYTGWTPERFVALVRELGEEAGYAGPIVVGLDHGGPWLKDLHNREKWPLDRAMQGVKDSLLACLEAGYDLLHVDPTVDRGLPSGEGMPIQTVVARTVELISHVETHRRARDLPPVSYEVGTEEVHGGLADLATFDTFLDGLRQGLLACGCNGVWPCFVVGKVGTDLHTTTFDSVVARNLVARAARCGSVIKGHYTDYVSHPESYPQCGIGGANVGPEFTEFEYAALEALARREAELGAAGKVPVPSGIMEALREAVVAGGRWEKWRQPEEAGLRFHQLSPQRQGWLMRTGCRYVWTVPELAAARQQLYANLGAAGEEGEASVLRAVADSMLHYYRAFGLMGSNERIAVALAGFR